MNYKFTITYYNQITYTLMESILCVLSIGLTLTSMGGEMTTLIRLEMIMLFFRKVRNMNISVNNYFAKYFPGF